MIIHSIKLNPFQIGYLTAALFSSYDESNDNGGNPLDDNYSLSDLAPATLAMMCAECDAFEEANAETLAAAEITCRGTDYATHNHEAEFTGYLFWMTRNHHGVGFWDGNVSEPHATLLTDASLAAGKRDLYVGDDGRIYQ